MSLGLLAAAAMVGHPLLAADPELTNYKSGIDLHFGTSASSTEDKGVAYMEEYFYFDKVVHDSKVVYIKSDTLISMGHNSRNIAGKADGSDTFSNAGTTVGVIKWKVDGDQYRGGQPPQWPTYSAPLSFAQMNYGFYGASGTPVVGTTGPTGGNLTEANRTTRYHRGILDSVGDEWHTITVADDDIAHTSNSEMRCSDGKVHLFVVNPKTPCATWRTSGTGQFYTTPPKKYFFPIIYDQTTYFTGTVTCEIRDINGNNVFYRINGGSFINAGTNHVTLNQGNFNTGTNKLEYYYAGNSPFTKTRIVVKNPGFPSAGESHGDRLWGSAALFTSEVKPRIDGDPELKKWKDFWRTNSLWNGSSAIISSSRQGKRRGFRSADELAFANAFTARWQGMNFKQSGYTHTAADIAKLALFETKALLDPVGYESSTWSNNSIASREVMYRGYYDVEGIYEAAGGYDILAGYYRSDQGYANGLTPIEDYFIRDGLARWVHNAQLIVSGYAPAGMWPTGHVTGAAVIAGMMPAYSTEYFGTCGLDGNTTTYDWTPFPNTSTNYTWKQLFLDNVVPVTGYPNCARQASPDEHFTQDGTWNDRIGYSTTNLFGRCVQVHYNMVKLFNPSATFSNVNIAMVKAAQGQLYGNKFTNESDKSPRFRAWAGLQNAWFPEFRSVAQPRMQQRVWPDSDGIGKQMQDGRTAFSIVHYNHNLPEGSGGVAPTPTVAAPTFSPQGGTYTTAQNVTMTSATGGAMIRYTTNGTTPTRTTGTIYSTPVPVSATTTLKAIAYNGTDADSRVRSTAYTINGSSKIQLPVISPSGGIYMAGQEISITCSTPGVTLYFTMDGSAPTAQSTLYKGSFGIQSNAVIRAIGVKAGLQTSDIITESYQIGNASSSDSIWESLSFDARTGMFVIRFEVSPGNNSLVGLCDGPAESWSDLAAIVRFAPEGKVDARNGSVYAAISSMNYSPNVSYRVAMTVNVRARTYSATVAAPGGNPVQIAANYAFRTEQSSTARLNALSVWTQVGEVTIGDIVIEDSPEIPQNLRIIGAR